MEVIRLQEPQKKPKSTTATRNMSSLETVATSTSMPELLAKGEEDEDEEDEETSVRKSKGLNIVVWHTHALDITVTGGEPQEGIGSETAFCVGRGDFPWTVGSREFLKLSKD
ncbi:hypothetical protein DFQ28_002126 [Apophysomyces sp. BC1034]|nr:hypothetical protein DFQ28_002126 [Apophysomyces sp. BC1034]